jgi:hypothetical protein
VAQCRAVGAKATKERQGPALRSNAIVCRRFRVEALAEEGGRYRRMAARLLNVARRAYASEATASRVLNGRRYVSITTRATVPLLATSTSTLSPAREIRVPATVRLRRSCGCMQDSDTPDDG